MELKFPVVVTFAPLLHHYLTVPIKPEAATLELWSPLVKTDMVLLICKYWCPIINTCMYQPMSCHGNFFIDS